MIKKELIEKLKPLSWITGTILSLIAIFKVIIPLFTLSSPILANYERIYLPANVWLWNDNITFTQKDSLVYYHNKNIELTDSLIENNLKGQNQIINNFIAKRSLLRLKLTNKTKDIVNNLEIIIPNYNNVGFKNKLKYLSYENDAWKYVNNKIKLSEILPNKSEVIYISGSYKYLFDYLVKDDLIKIKHQNSTINFYPRKYIYTENKFDLFITNLVVGNKWIQLLGIIIIPLGIFFFLRILYTFFRKIKTNKHPHPQ